MLRKICSILLVALSSSAWPAAAWAASDIRVPPGYSVLSRQPLGPGLTHVTLASRNQRVHVAYVAPGSAYELRSVLSNEAIKEDGERLERTSDMCRRVRCLAAVNGDFFSEDGIPLGAVVSGSELIRTPNPAHHQLMIGLDGRPSTGTFDWRGRLVATDLTTIQIDAVNVERGANQIVLYTPAFGGSTETNAFGDELTLRVVQPSGAPKIGQTSLVELTAYRRGTGDTPLLPGELVLSGHGKGAAALAALWGGVQGDEAATHALLRLDGSPKISESIGGTPILVRNGARWFSEDNAFARAAAPRTMVGWDSAGGVMLVTVDGRQPRVAAGMSLAQAAELMIALGATEAINLDGGGSTTFVVRGTVANQPSDRLVRRNGTAVTVRTPSAGETVLAYVERPVADALAIVASGVDDRLSDPFAGAAVELPSVLGSPTPRANIVPALPLATTGGVPPAGSIVLAVGACAMLAAWTRRRVA